MSHSNHTIDAPPAYRRPWLRRALRLSELPGALGIERGEKGVWTPDFVVLCVLVALTVVFGRAFSKVKVVPGTPIYVTEVAIAATAVFAVWRVGLRRSVERVRKVVPVVPLLVFWLAGAIAAARGLYSFGFRRVQPDIALAEYSVFLPLLAVVLDTRARIMRLLAVVLASSFVITLVYAVLLHVEDDNWLLRKDPAVAITMYITFGVLLVVMRLVTANRVTPLELVLVAIGLLMISLSTVRAAIFALAAALLAVVVLAPRGRRLPAAGVACGALLLSVGGALLIERATPSAEIVVVPTSSAPFGDRFVADDRGTVFTGGIEVQGDAASGIYSRKLFLGERYNLAALTGLQPGKLYTVVFAVKPIDGRASDGLVGDPTGLQWGQAYWSAAPILRWQFFRKTLRATSTTETLAVVATAGTPAVLVDSVRVVKGQLPGPSGDFVPQRAVARPDFLADDSLTAFEGGRIMPGYALQGGTGRLAARGERLEISTLKRLRRGLRYTVSFAVRPLEPVRTRGFVGNPSGRGWGSVSWTTKPTTKWQFFHETLVPTASTEVLALEAVKGAPEVLFDAVAVRKGIVAPARPNRGPGVADNPTLKPNRPPGPENPAPTTAPPKKQGALAHEFSALGGDTTSSGRNVRWRLAIWRYMLEKTLHEPVLGVGFGHPTNFRWEGLTYDARVFDPLNMQDITGPHNSFVNLIFRMGLLGVLPLLALIGIAAVRLWRALRRGDRSRLDLALLAACAAIFVCICVTASFSVALEGPFMGIFFWIFLGLVLILSRPAATDS